MTRNDKILNVEKCGKMWKNSECYKVGKVGKVISPGSVYCYLNSKVIIYFVATSHTNYENKTTGK